MKKTSVLSGILGCGVLAFAVAAPAQPRSVKNAERYHAKFVLTATPDAPSGAKGNGELNSTSRGTNETTTLKLKTIGLDAGDYTVTGVNSSGGTEPLGQFTIENKGKGRGKLSSVSKADISGVDISDLTQLVVADANGTAMLEGDLADTSGRSRANFNARVPIIPGVAAPDATGFARLRTTTKKGVEKNRFTLLGSKFPPNSTFTVVADGTDAGTVTSNRKGKLLVKKLPAEITNIHTVQLLDDTGAQAAEVNF
jgi:hypothetical protein